METQMKRMMVFAYGVACYAAFFLTFLYAVGFVGNILVPKSMDSEPAGSFAKSLIVDLLLLSAFALQHSIMARQGFKEWWTRFVPKPMERSTYVLLATAALIQMFAFWRPLGGVVWDIENPVSHAVLYGMFGFGWLLVLLSTILINHFELFGLRQVYLYLRGREYTPLGFVTPGPYKYVRHPLYLGFLIAFWATPTMTVTHLLFALTTTAYVLVAIWFEERDLIRVHGRSYVEYRRRVPMLIPNPAAGAATMESQREGSAAS
jgi:protein-S-isoprenylcysteine O-methyltransferase Ste14